MTLQPASPALHRLALAILVSLSLTYTALPQSPELTITRTPNGQVQLSWPDNGTAYAVDRISDLSPGGTWQATGLTPTTTVGQNQLQLSPGSDTEFYRLRSTSPVPTRLASISPANGEAGVSVTRETIIQLSAPLAETTTVTTNDLLARLGNQPILSRTHISADRKRITLFYLEPLPSSARVQVDFHGDNLLDEQGLALDANGDGLPGGTRTITFDTMSHFVVPGTVVIGRVLASDPIPTPGGFEDRPLEGVILTVDGAEESTWTTTDAQGYFRIDPAPTGRFFVHIDGRLAPGSSWPDGNYYPVVGKTFIGITGATNNMTGGQEIYLPLVQAGTLQTVSATETTTVEFPNTVLTQHPELTGVSLQVPPNSLFTDNGTRGGQVGIAPVPPDRIPSPLPQGLDFPLVITVQTDGPSNFDLPVPVRFPNLPNPTTGLTPAPGEKAWLFSFNHDTGKWEPQGTMTISPDGLYAESDPGVGILQPGWHGVTTSTPPVYPEEPEDDCNLGLDDLWDLVSTSVECFEDVTKLGRTLDLAATAPVKLIDATANIASAIDALNAGDAGQAAKPALGAIKDFRDAVNEMIDYGTDSTPEQKLLNTINCALKIYAWEMNLLCEILDCLFPEKPAWMFSCTPLNAVTSTVDILISNWETFKGGITKAPLGALNLAIDALEAGLPDDVTPNALQRSDLRRQSLTPEEIIALLQDAQNAMEELTAMMDGVDELRDNLHQLETLIEPPFTQTPSIVLSREQQHPNTYFLLEYEGFQNRGQSSPLGHFELSPMPGLTPYTFSLYIPHLNTVAQTNGISSSPGEITPIPDPILLTPDVTDTSGDTDADGLSDLAEYVIGTRPDLPDTDNDGLSDFFEVQQGLNPLSGLNLPVGVIAQLPLSSDAMKITTDHNTALIATADAGLALVDITTPEQPLLLAELDLPGFNHDVVASPTTGIAAILADASTFNGPDFGIHLVSYSNPANPSLIRTIHVQASLIQELNGLLYALVDNQLRTYDITTGLELSWITLDPPPEFIEISPNLMVVSQAETLTFFTPTNTGWTEASSLPHSLGYPKCLLLDGPTLFFGTFTGFITIDVSDPTSPAILGQPDSTQLVNHALASNGSGMLAVVSSFAGPATLDLSLYDVRDLTDTTRFLTTITTPGAPNDVALHHGIAYVADGSSGLTVCNYLSFDTQAQAPVVSLNPANLDTDPATPGTQVIAGSQITIQASITDDTQISEASLLVLDSVVDTITAAPTQWTWLVPTNLPPGTIITLQAQATDTGGNTGSSNPIELEILADTTPPTLALSLPSPNQGAFANEPLVLRFTEYLSLFDPNLATLTHLGPDAQPGTADDTTIPFDTATIIGSTLTLANPTPWPTGFYTLTLQPSSLLDLSGNPMSDSLTLQFLIADASSDNAVWISSTDGQFNDPANWLHQRVPANEDVTLPNAFPLPPLVTVSSKDHIIRSLDAHLPLLLINGSELETRTTLLSTSPVTVSNSYLYVNGPAQFDSTLELTGGTLQSYDGPITLNNDTTIQTGGSLILDGPAASLEVNGTLNAVNCTFETRDSATLTLPQFTHYSGPGDFTPFLPAGTLFRARGNGSTIHLPNLETVTGPTDASLFGIPYVRFEATQGGSISLPTLTTLANRTTLASTSTGSTIQAPNLSSIQGPASSPYPSTIEVSGTSTLQLAPSTLINQTTLTLSGTATLNASQLELTDTTTLQGAGTLNGNLLTRGRVYLNQTPDPLLITGNLALTPTSTLENLIGLGFNRDQTGHLEVQGQTSLAGTWTTSIRNGFTPAEGQTFSVATFQIPATGSLTPSMPTLSNPALSLQPTATTQNLSLTIIPTP